MQSECPVLASFSSSIPEVVGDSAILFHPEKYEEIYDSMKKLVEDEELQKKLVKQGLKQATKFSWNKSAQKLLQIFKDLK